MHDRICCVKLSIWHAPQFCVDRVRVTSLFWHFLLPLYLSCLLAHFCSVAETASDRRRGQDRCFGQNDIRRGKVCYNCIRKGWAPRTLYRENAAWFIDPGGSEWRRRLRTINCTYDPVIVWLAHFLLSDGSASTSTWKSINTTRKTRLLDWLLCADEHLFAPPRSQTWTPRIWSWRLIPRQRLKLSTWRAWKKRWTLWTHWWKKLSINSMSKRSIQSQTSPRHRTHFYQLKSAADELVLHSDFDTIANVHSLLTRCSFGCHNTGAWSND